MCRKARGFESLLPHSLKPTVGPGTELGASAAEAYNLSENVLTQQTLKTKKHMEYHPVQNAIINSLWELKGASTQMKPHPFDFDVLIWLGL